MKSLSKKLVVVLLAVAMVFTFAACGSKDSGSAEEGGSDVPVLKIGSTGPLSGPASIYGTAVEKGAKIAVEEIKAKEKEGKEDTGGFLMEAFDEAKMLIDRAKERKEARAAEGHGKRDSR